MRLSHFYLPTQKETPSDAQIASHRLMLKAGMVYQSSAGIYTWLPLGLRVLRKIENIINEEMDAAGCQEVLMPTIQSAELWQKSGRLDSYGKEMLKFKDRHDRELLYGPTNEELITEVFSQHIKSYRDIPKNLYQIQWKFRDEIRPRFGVMRGREFLMKDAYSFDIDYEGAKKSYWRMYQTYLKIFKRMGLTAIPVRADSGAIGGDMSHEFQILAPAGESSLYYEVAFESLDFDDPNVMDEVVRLYAAVDEKHDPQSCPVPPHQLKQSKGIEVGHIFYFGSKYSEPLGAKVMTPSGQLVNVEMGSYGIGVSRLVGAIIEANFDGEGIKWPDPVAPFQVGIVNAKTHDPKAVAFADAVYEKLKEAGVETLYDDTDERPGAKFANMDLIGLPWQVIVGAKAVEKGIIEIKRRSDGTRQELDLTSFINQLAA
ncbi:MAG: proline--tRNA ligase [Alphaproteobacteria bacterium]|nr:proline--tRNA ligase [Alphaproteobacteria bacterium]OJV45100.1 MAG: proline--tRNA ligase [Alphaproteobacteria bacterium 43-37]